MEQCNLDKLDSLRGREPLEGERPQKYDPIYDEKVIKKYNHPGIYSISVANKVLYIGRANNMYRRIFEHRRDILKSNEKKYVILRQALQDGQAIQFNVVFYTTKVRKDAVQREINEREAYYINYYLPPLNRQIPDHPKFEKQHSLIDQVETYQQALQLSKGGAAASFIV